MSTAWWMRLLVFHALGAAIVAGPGLAQLGPVPIGWVRRGAPSPAGPHRVRWLRVRAARRDGRSPPPFGLFVRRLQPVLVPAGLLMHALFYLLLPAGPFSAEMMLCYLAFLDPERVHRTLDALLIPTNDTWSTDPP